MRLPFVFLLTACLVFATAPLYPAFAAAGGDFRNSDGKLDLPDCASAQAWMKTVKGRVASDDQVRIVMSAYLCAKSGKAEAARRLLELADSAPTRPDRDLFFEAQRIKVLLALGEHEQAGQPLRALSRETLTTLGKNPTDDQLQLVASVLQRLNNDMALQQRATQPAIAIEHQLYAADAHEQAGDLGLIEMASLYQLVALEIALESRLLDASIDISRRIFALHARHPGLSTHFEARTVAQTVSLLLDAGRETDALALTKELMATGWPDAEQYAKPLLHHLERVR